MYFKSPVQRSFKIFGDINFPTADIRTSSSQDFNLHIYDQILMPLFSHYSGSKTSKCGHSFPTSRLNTTGRSHMFSTSKPKDHNFHIFLEAPKIIITFYIFSRSANASNL